MMEGLQISRLALPVPTFSDDGCTAALAGRHGLSVWLFLRLAASNLSKGPPPNLRLKGERGGIRSGVWGCGNIIIPEQWHPLVVRVGWNHFLQNFNYFVASTAAIPFLNRSSTPAYAWQIEDR